MHKRHFLVTSAAALLVPHAFAATDPFAAASSSTATPLVINLPHKKIIFTDADLSAMPQATLSNLTTPWYKEPQTFSGPLLRTILEKAGIARNEKLRIMAHNDYSVDLPASDAWNFDVILATHNNAKRMSLKEKGPFFTMYPLNDPKLATQQYFSRCVWQVISIDVK